MAEDTEAARFTLRLPADLMQATHTLAGLQGMSTTQYIEKAVRRQVKADAGDEGLREQLLDRLAAAAEHGG